MKVLVCGGRDFHDYARLSNALDQYPVEHIVNGGAMGADRWSSIYAGEKGLACTVWNAKWSEHGKAAGPIRNQRMLEAEEPDLVIVFPGGPGTAHMVRIAQEGGYRVVRG